MSPVAITSPSIAEKRYKSAPGTTMPTPPLTATPPIGTLPKPIPLGLSFDDIHSPSRRPSPWHDLAHSLSTTPTPHRPSLSHSDPSTPPSPPLSTSQALREWEARLALPTSAYSRHTLLPPPSPVTPSPPLVPKLVPERDKEGHIEYKLKLINPSAERFERLVTQMMWRLKQGRNEAIYELGLADDGTVVGLSRADMDASLKTLELMASEVGATVLVLKEIVLTGRSCTPINSLTWNADADTPGYHDPSAGWVAHRPWSNAAVGKEVKEVKKKKSKKWGRGFRRTQRSGEVAARAVAFKGERQIVFDTAETGESSGEENDTPDEVDDRRGESRSSTNSLGERSDDDIPPFHLDMEDSRRPHSPKAPGPDCRIPTSASVAPSTMPSSKKTGRRRGRRTQAVTEEERKERDTKNSVKARKAMARREERRLSLLRGDGMSPSPFDEALAGYVQPEPGVGVGSSFVLPHAPRQPSSLRLATPAPVDATSISIDNQSSNGEAHDAEINVHTTRDEKGEDEDHDAFQDLLSLPLDSLSLSFADVCTVSPSSPSSSVSSSSTEYAPTLNILEEDRLAEALEEGEERICVEALVVRKTQHGEEDEEWGWGGDDDAWGLSAEAYDYVQNEARLENGSKDEGKQIKEEVEEEEGGVDPWGF